jgi:phage terminase large subunit
MEVNLPHNWRPRAYQQPAWEALESGTTRAALIWHRRAGKDLFAINWCATQLFQRVGLYWHVLPTYNQGRKVVWEGRTRDGRAFLDHFPGDGRVGPDEPITRKRDDSMALWFANGSVYQVIGAEEPDRLVGSNPVGIIFSEWSVMPPRVWEYLRPILAENGGWVVFIYTPRGRNHGYRTFKMAQETEGWFAERLTVENTNSVTQEAIEAERAAGMPEELIQQEFYCSFDAPLIGAYWGDLLSKMMEDERIAKIPYEPGLPVTTAWDLGMADYTSIWFHQLVGHEHRLIDYYQSSGVGLDHYAKVLSEKPYTYNEHLVPHDATVRELGTGKSRIETARKLGLNMRVVPKIPLADGINAVRFLLPKTWIDEENCGTGIEGLRQYTKERVLDEEGAHGEALFRDKPLHNWASHPADALRTLAVGLREFRKHRDVLYPEIAIV